MLFRSVARLQHELAEVGIENAEIYGRPKHIYSIWNKMRKKGVEFRFQQPWWYNICAGIGIASWVVAIGLILFSGGSRYWDNYFGVVKGEGWDEPASASTEKREEL